MLLDPDVAESDRPCACGLQDDMTARDISLGQVGGEGAIQPDSEPVVLEGDAVPVPPIDGIHMMAGNHAGHDGTGAMLLDGMQVIDIHLIAVRRVDLLMLAVDKDTGVDGAVGIEFQFHREVGVDLAGDQKAGLTGHLTGDLVVHECPGCIAGGGPVVLAILDQPLGVFAGNDQEHAQNEDGE